MKNSQFEGVSYTKKGIDSAHAADVEIRTKRKGILGADSKLQQATKENRNILSEIEGIGKTYQEEIGEELQKDLYESTRGSDQAINEFEKDAERKAVDDPIVDMLLSAKENAIYEEWENERDNIKEWYQNHPIKKEWDAQVPFANYYWEHTSSLARILLPSDFLYSWIERKYKKYKDELTKKSEALLGEYKTKLNALVPKYSRLLNPEELQRLAKQRQIDGRDIMLQGNVKYLELKKRKKRAQILLSPDTLDEKNTGGALN